MKCILCLKKTLWRWTVTLPLFKSQAYKYWWIGYWQLILLTWTWHLQSPLSSLIFSAWPFPRCQHQMSPSGSNALSSGWSGTAVAPPVQPENTNTIYLPFFSWSCFQNHPVTVLKTWCSLGFIKCQNLSASSCWEGFQSTLNTLR